MDGHFEFNIDGLFVFVPYHYLNLNCSNLRTDLKGTVPFAHYE